MVRPFILPSPLSSTHSSRDAILSILSEKWPLSAKEIYQKLKTDYGFTASYQTIHKTLMLLCVERIVEKTGLEYKLDKDWISKIKRFGDRTAQTYFANVPADFFSKDIITLSFDNFISAAKFIVDDYSAKAPNPEKKPSLCLWEHTWCWIGVSEEEYNNLKKIFSTVPHYSLCKENTFLDNYFSKFLEKLGKKCLCGVDYSATGDMFVQGNYIAQVYYSAEFRKTFFKLYENTKSLEEVDSDKIFSVISAPSRINIVISKNVSFADKLRENIALFDEKDQK